MTAETLAPARPLGHDTVFERLFGAARDGRLAHALLLAGPEGVGKFMAARWFAGGLLCEAGPGDPCGACGPCKRVAAGTHPDLFVVDAAGEGFDQLTVHFVATRSTRPQNAYSGPSIESFLDLRAAEGRGKVVVVREAERMNEEAQNAFLKTLEEPRPGVVIVLECSAPGALLATVHSRLVRVDIGRLDDATVASIVGESPEFAALDAAERTRLLRLASGAPGRAERLARRGVPAMRDVLDRAISGELAPHEAARELWQLEGDFPGRTAAAVRRLRAETFLDLGLEVLRDLERRRAGLAPERLVHGDAPDPRDVGEVARRRRMDAWGRARQDVLRNLGPEALVDRALAAL